MLSHMHQIQNEAVRVKEKTGAEPSNAVEEALAASNDAIPGLVCFLHPSSTVKSKLSEGIQLQT